jgi:2-hydroxy-3-keto-5-methylthiopentenyl-1-phosphate phosphatase
MTLLNNSIESETIESINNYFENWSKIKTNEEHLIWSNNVPFFGTYKTRSIIEMIDFFVGDGVKVLSNNLMRDFRNEINSAIKRLENN